MQTYWQLKEGQGSIEMGDDFGQPLTTRIFHFFRKSNYGEILNRAEFDRPTRKEFQRKLRSNKLKTKCLDVFMKDDYSEIEIVDMNPKKNFIIKFVPQELFRPGEDDWQIVIDRDTTSNENIYPVNPNSSQFLYAIENVDFLRDVLKCPIGKVTLETGVFKEEGVDHAPYMVNTLKKCEHMFIIGKETTLKQVEYIIRNMKVSKSLFIRDALIDNGFTANLLSSIPSTEFCLTTATPQQVFDLAAETSQISVASFSVANFNELIRIWMSTNNSRVRKLIMKVPGTSREDIELFFTGLKVIPGLVPVCGFRKRCNQSGCVHHKLRFFFETGIEFHRIDGAVATVFYSDVSPLFNFAMHVTYPGKPHLTVAQIRADYDVISKICVKAAHQFIQQTKLTGATDKAINSPEAASWSSEETAQMKKLKFLQCAHMSKISSHLYTATRELDTLRHVDLRYHDHSDRKKYGFLVFPFLGEGMEEQYDQYLEETRKRAVHSPFLRTIARVFRYC